MNWFDTNLRLSSSIVDGFNKKAKLTIKMAFGFKSENTCNMPYIIRFESYQRQNLSIDLTVKTLLLKKLMVGN
ncbi:hypothetical protein ACX8XP_10875 [Calditrichota bacterium LG25]